jgi:hypothetical protein
MLSILLPFAVGFHPFFRLLDLRLFGLELARLPGRQGSALNPLVDPLNNPSPKRFRCLLQKNGWQRPKSRRAGLAGAAARHASADGNACRMSCYADVGLLTKPPATC